MELVGAVCLIITGLILLSVLIYIILFEKKDTFDWIEVIALVICTSVVFYTVITR